MNYPAASHGVSKARQQHETISKQASGYGPAGQSIKTAQNLLGELVRLALQEPVGIPFFVMGDQMHDLFGPSTSNYHECLRQIKKAFDPNGASDSLRYITAKE
jgi:hypothetical protein